MIDFLKGFALAALAVCIITFVIYALIPPAKASQSETEICSTIPDGNGGWIFSDCKVAKDEMSGLVETAHGLGRHSKSCTRRIDAHGRPFDDCGGMDPNEKGDEICDRHFGQSRHARINIVAARTLTIECLQLFELRRIRGALERLEGSKADGFYFPLPR